MPILTPEERIGQVLAGRYKLESVLGQGGMGYVMGGQHELTGRKVAVKLLLPSFGSDGEIVGRFFQEAKAAASLNHPNVVDVLDMQIDDGEAFLVLELLDGQPLTDLLEERGPLPPEELFPILMPVIDALAAAHEHGIVHRDLKPDNIFISKDLRGRVTPKVLDFGIAKLTEGDSSVETRTGGLLGTPHYMSPEQAQGQKSVGPSTDIWSMGVLIYECLTGDRAFQADSVPALLLQICTFDPIPLADRAPGVHPAIARVVHKALARDLADRYASMEELGGALFAACQEAGVVLPASLEELFPQHRPTIAPGDLPVAPSEPAPIAQPAPTSSPSASKAPVFAVAFLLALGGLGAAAYLLMAPAPPPATPPAVASPEPATPEPATPEPAEPAPQEAGSQEAGSQEAAAAPEAPADVTHRVISEPAGAEVVLDGEVIGEAPLAVTRPGDVDALEVTVRLRRHRARTVTIDADSPEEIVVVLPRRHDPPPAGSSSAPALAPR
ncbi:MAG: protein kinase [Myxococcota bacterium]|nr:protein kinase [Myxococcota bacterium]